MPVSYTHLDISYNEALFTLEREETKLTRKFDSRPFVPGIKEERERRCDEILNIQAMGLKKRLAHIHCQNAVIGLSGGCLLYTSGSSGHLAFLRNDHGKHPLRTSGCNR